MTTIIDYAEAAIHAVGIIATGFCIYALLVGFFGG